MDGSDVHDATIMQQYMQGPSSDSIRLTLAPLKCLGPC